MHLHKKPPIQQRKMAAGPQASNIVYEWLVNTYSRPQVVDKSKPLELFRAHKPHQEYTFYTNGSQGAIV